MTGEVVRQSGKTVQPREGSGQQTPYDAQRANYQGVEVLVHNNAASIGRALDQERPSSRVFTFFSSSLFSSQQRVSFIDGERRVHAFSEDLTTDAQNDAMKAEIWGPIQRHGHREADGIIRIDDQTGDVYQVYETDRPEASESIGAQVQAWTEDVRAASAINPGDGLLQHITETDVTIADYTQGRNHMVTVLRNEEGYTLDSATEGLPEIPMQDNGPVLRWAKVIRP